MLAEAGLLEKSVRATWDFIDYEQPNINYDRDGTYNFKGSTARWWENRWASCSP